MNRNYSQLRTAERTKTKRFSSFLPLIHTDQSSGPVGTLALEPDGLKLGELDAKGKKKDCRATEEAKKHQKLKSRQTQRGRKLLGALAN